MTYVIDLEDKVKKARMFTAACFEINRQQGNLNHISVSAYSILLILGIPTILILIAFKSLMENYHVWELKFLQICSG